MSHLLPQLWTPCTTPDELHLWAKQFLHIDIPRRAVCANHHAPFEYLRSAYFEPASDLVVWAPRGGAKTRIAAAATLLDLLHKPGCSIRILGGSLDQSLRMWEHLLPDLERLVDAQAQSQRSRRIQLNSGSTAAVLTQSQRAVRGLRIQKLRCDEVELFKPEIWEAAQLATRTIRRAAPASGPATIAGVIEALSTLHTPFGLMQRIIEQAEEAGTRIIRWCLLEVLQRCPAERDCGTCPLWDDCGGVAKTSCDGYFEIDDAIAMKRRVSREVWEAEMLCRRPSVRGCVFACFDPDVHVVDRPFAPGDAELTLGIDFGYSSPFVCLWVLSDPAGRTFVIDEYIQPQRMMHEHIEQLRQRQWGKVRMIACDPAGQARNDQTAASNVMVLKQAGYVVRSRKSHIVDGLEMIRAALRPASGEPRLFIHPRCKRLIRALQSYRYPPGGSELPKKDGEHDHPVDALRYYFVNRKTKSAEAPRRY